MIKDGNNRKSVPEFPHKRWLRSGIHSLKRRTDETGALTSFMLYHASSTVIDVTYQVTHRIKILISTNNINVLE